MIKSGKRLENSVKKSADEQGIFCYRLRDSGTSFGTNANIRFTSSNMCDYLMYYNKKMLCLEAKNHKGKSLPLSCVRPNQVVQLTNASKFDGVMAGLLVFFEDVEECYYLSIEQYNSFNSERKSIPIEYFKENGRQITIHKMKTNYKYNIKEIFE